MKNKMQELRDENEEKMKKQEEIEKRKQRALYVSLHRNYQITKEKLRLLV